MCTVYIRSAIFPTGMQHLSTASNPKPRMLQTDKGASTPMVSQKTVINEPTPAESGSVILHLHSSVVRVSTSN
ncbi:hypothetical protein NQZ68_018734 [Dissostichus eleginoides]|nr:hypothetical protein NQZ68_018734 [Dissostichus eleginoides]